MIKHTLALLLVVALSTSCTSPKKEVKTTNSETPIRVVEIHHYPQDYDVETGCRTAPVVKPQDWEDFDPAKQLSNSFLSVAKENRVELSMKSQVMSPEGNLVLTLNGDSIFPDDATITIGASEFSDFKTVVSRMKSIIDMSSEQGKRIKSIMFTDGNKVPVTYGK